LPIKDKGNFTMTDSEHFDPIKQSITAGNRIYSFEIKVAENDSKYLIITENRTKIQEFHTVMVFEEDIEVFLDTLIAVLSEGQLTTKINKQKESIYLKSIRKDYPNAYKAWTKHEEQLLILMLSQGKSEQEIAITLKRKIGAIKSRIKKVALYTKPIKE